MRRLSNSLSSVAKATVSRSKGRAMVSSQWYSTVSPPKDEDLEEEEEVKEEEEEEVKEEDEFSLKKKTFIPFPESFGGGFLVDKKKETKKSIGGTSSFGQGTHMNYDYGISSGESNNQRTTDTNNENEEGNKIQEYGGCNGCPGCIRCGCPGCSGGCRYCFGCCGCKY
ncbi:hypothetical protein ISN45_Aa08g018980 [Arabidopsis thaliana x Arabidopsis arenosa]|uniref:Uncharacterized protein n=1 Tax=Arabidopsis thaliana x Arabidopsis arenosa TaxID=1240361 RepID=A0A8T1XJH6_9BRAS|nr:hypothetical protein ISN45_Aa08g018980 [Arabidopsis thaliana x Arabidopsis arenosa]